MSQNVIKTLFAFVAAIVVFTTVSLPNDVYCATGSKDVSVVAVITRDEFMGKLNEPYGLYMDEQKDRLYVADSLGKRLVSFDNSFQFLSELSDEKIKMPLGVYKTVSGDFYVLDGATKELKLINLRERSVKSVAFSNIPKDDEVFLPGGFTLDSKEDIYIIDSMNPRVLVFGPDGAYKRKFAPPKADNVATIKDVRVDASGNVYIVAPYESAFYVFNAKGDVTYRVYGGGKSGRDVVMPVSVDVDVSGLIYILDKGVGRIAVYSTVAKEPLYFLGSRGHNDGEFFALEYLLVSKKKARLYVVDGTRIQVLDVVEGK